MPPGERVGRDQPRRAPAAWSRSPHSAPQAAVSAATRRSADLRPRRSWSADDHHQQRSPSEHRTPTPPARTPISAASPSSPASCVASRTRRCTVGRSCRSTSVRRSLGQVRAVVVTAPPGHLRTRTRHDRHHLGLSSGRHPHPAPITTSRSRVRGTASAAPTVRATWRRAGVLPPAGSTACPDALWSTRRGCPTVPKADALAWGCRTTPISAVVSVARASAVRPPHHPVTWRYTDATRSSVRGAVAIDRRRSTAPASRCPLRSPLVSRPRPRSTAPHRGVDPAVRQVPAASGASRSRRRQHPAGPVGTRLAPAASSCATRHLPVRTPVVPQSDRRGHGQARHRPADRHWKQWPDR